MFITFRPRKFPARPTRFSLFLTAVGVALMAVTMSSGPAGASHATGPVTRTDTKPTATDAVPVDQRNAALGRKWTASRDVAVTGAGDVNGFHLFRASGNAGYRWQPLVTLSEAGFDADQWIGNVCVTGGGRKAVVVYAPRTFSNKAELFARGGFVAIVDLTTGATTKLPIQASLAYFNPGCGSGDDAILTQGGGDDRAKTRLVRVDTRTNRLGKRTTVAGELTSAVPVGSQIFGADSGAIVRIDDRGRRHVVAAAAGTPYRLAADRDGGVTYLERHDTQAAVRRVVPGPGKARTLANGPLSGLDVAKGTDGRVFVLGSPQRMFSAGSKAVSFRRAPVGSAPSGDGSLGS